MSGSSPLYAAIDLGSNSFHLLIVRNVEGAVRAVVRIKRKVRLASGLDAKGILSREAMIRGWDCLRLFADQLQNIPANNIRIVATATLRFAKNAQDFVLEGERILRHEIQVISGETEARTIYHGVMSTSGARGNILVVDIGGGSTELIAGNGPEIHVIHSLKMGCVTWMNRFFSDGLITEENYDKAIAEARQVLAPFAAEYLHIGFQCCLGASGTVQAIHEIMVAQGENERVTLDVLRKLRKLTVEEGSMDKLAIPGLTQERLVVFPGGLAILTAIYEVLQIGFISLAGGALREGIIYSILGDFSSGDVKVRTVDSLIARYQLDREQAQRIMTVALSAFGDVKDVWKLDDVCSDVLKAASMLSEIGLCIEYKKAPQHAAYIISNIDMPGFSVAQKYLLSALLYNERDDFKQTTIKQQNAVSYDDACKLIRLLRLAIIICIGRNDDVIGQNFRFTASESGKLELHVENPNQWKSHYLLVSLLKEEQQREQQAGWQLEMNI